MDTYDTSGSTNTPRQQSFARDPLLWRYIQTRNASNLSITILPRNKTCSYDTSCIYPIATIILRHELNKLTESSKNQDYSSPPCAIPLGRLQLTLKIQHNGFWHWAAWLPDSTKQSYGEHIKEKPKEFHNRILQPYLSNMPIHFMAENFAGSLASGQKSLDHKKRCNSYASLTEGVTILKDVHLKRD